jgi:hypothetical protein
MLSAKLEIIIPFDVLKATSAIAASAYVAFVPNYI